MSLHGKAAAVLVERDLSLPKLVASLVSGAEERLHILQIGGEDLFHHAAREFGDQAVERDRRVTLFIREARPEQIVGVPGLGQKAAGVAHECRKRRDVEQRAAVILRQRWVGYAEVAGEALPADLVGILLVEGVKIGAGRAAKVSVIRESAAIFGGEIKGI